MDRKEFLFSLGKGAIAVCGACYLASCSSDSPTSPQNSNVDLTLDLSLTENSALSAVGGYTIKNGIIIVKTGATSFTAVSAACTHEGTTLVYDKNNSRFHCNNHGSNFNLEGTVINGPASKALAKYKTELNGNILRIFS